MTDHDPVTGMSAKVALLSIPWFGFLLAVFGTVFIGFNLLTILMWMILVGMHTVSVILYFGLAKMLKRGLAYHLLIFVVFYMVFTWWTWDSDSELRIAGVWLIHDGAVTLAGRMSSLLWGIVLGSLSVASIWTLIRYRNRASV